MQWAAPSGVSVLTHASSADYVSVFELQSWLKLGLN